MLGWVLAPEEDTRTLLRLTALQRLPKVDLDGAAVTRTLDLMGVRYVSAINGAQMWTELKKIASYADASGRKVSDLVSMILTDVEMPEMDGYILTKHIKADPRFAGIPVVMHSSLSSGSNQQLGRSVGVDEYVSKFEAQRLAETISRLIRRGNGGDRAAA